VALLFFFSIPVQSSSLKITWFGTTCTTISDGKTTLLFDPFFTRPSLWKVASFWPLKSDAKTVAKWLKSSENNPVKAIFISHTHYDHALDLVAAARQTGGQVYGSRSAQNISLGGSIPVAQTTVITAASSYEIGDFIVTPLKGTHPNHFLGLTLASGPIKDPLAPKSSAMSYRMGTPYAFLIKHPAGTILFHPSGVTQGKFHERADIVIQGIAGRESSKALIDQVLKPSSTKVVIPTHYDKLSGALADGIQTLSWADLDEFRKSLRTLMPNVLLKNPRYGQPLEFSFPESPEALAY